MKTIKAVYEGGVFRPLNPVELPEGVWVEMNVISQNGVQKASKPLVGEELAALLAEIDALPLEGEPYPTLSTRY